MYIGSYCLCLHVSFHIRTLKIRLYRLLQIKITSFHEKHVYGSTHPRLKSTPTEGFASQMTLSYLYRLQWSMYQLLGSVY